MFRVKVFGVWAYLSQLAPPGTETLEFHVVKEMIHGFIWKGWKNSITYIYKMMITKMMSDSNSVCILSFCVHNALVWPRSCEDQLWPLCIIKALLEIILTMTNIINPSSSRAIIYTSNGEMYNFFLLLSNDALVDGMVCHINYQGWRHIDELC